MWIEIQGYEYKYAVSINGEVKSLPRIKSNNQPVKEKIMKQYSDSNGYMYVCLYKDGKNKRVRVHRLVAIAFIEKNKLSEKLVVNHKNGIKNDNRVDNLEWVTYGENKSHSFKMLGEKHWLKGKFGKDCKSSKKVGQYTLVGDIIREFDSIECIGRETGLKISNISSVCNGKRNSANGFKWRFL